MAATTGGFRLPKFGAPSSPGAPGSPESPIRQPTVRRAETMQSPPNVKLNHCSSAPSVIGSDTGLFVMPFAGTMWEAERHRRHVMLSPQGLFARTSPPPRLGAMACERYHQLGLEDPRRANQLQRPSSSRPSSSRSVRSLCDGSLDRSWSPRRCSKDSVLGSRPHSSKTEKTEDNESTWSRRPSDFFGRSSSAAKITCRDAATFREYQNRRDCFDFREGLRVAILDKKPAPLGAEKIWPPPPEERRPATREETLKVYALYKEWLRMQEGEQSQEEDEFAIAVDNTLASEGGLNLSVNIEHSIDNKVRVTRVDFGPLADWNLKCTETPEDVGRTVRPQDCIIEVNGFRGETRLMLEKCREGKLLHLVVERPRRLTTILWDTFNSWAYMKAYLADTPREKAVYTSMYKAQKAYLKFQMRSKLRSNYGCGLTLTALMRWVWPTLRPPDIANMYTWLSHYELESIRQDTPRLISKETRRQIEGIFQEMDWNKKGVLTAADFSGGENQDITALLKNCVDEATVHKVLGEGPINLVRFLELMCEDDCRGHEDATKALLKDGRYVVEQVREVIAFRGWVFEEMPKEEQPIRRRIDALEAEVKHWRMISRGRVREREVDRGPACVGSTH